MKKYFSLISAAALLLVGCAKEVPAVTDGDGAVTFSVALNEATKASADNDGMGANVDNIKVAVYMHTGVVANPYKFYDAPVAVYDAATKTGTFTVNLIKSQTYQIVVWADKNGRYTCENNLQVIKRADEEVCNEDEYDAFFATVEFTQGVTASTTITAKRPFAQLNVITTDIKAGFEPSTVAVMYKAPSQFNALTNAVSAPELFTRGADVYKKDPTAAQNTIIMDYIFATAEDGVVLDEVATKVQLVSTIDASYFNIPVKRNYRTNIIGALLTDPTDFKVVVDADWDGETNVDPYAAADVETVQNMLNKGAKEIHLETAPTEDVVLKVYKDYAATNVLHITFPDTDKKVTFEYGESGNQSYPALSFEGNVNNLVVNMPQSTVTLNGTFGNIEATTAANTLFITEGSTFNALDVKGGNVVLYGYDLFSKTTLANNCGAYIHLLSAADLKAYAAAAPEKARCAGVTAILDVDVDLNNEEWTPMGGYAFAFDGNGHTVSNLKVDTEAKNVGFFGIPTSAKISNLTIDGASVKGINHVAVLAGDGLCAQIENCTVKNATVESIVKDNDDGDKAGAITGYLSAEPTAFVKNCHVENVTVKAYRDLAAVVGYANGASVVSGNTAKDVKVICNTDNNYKNYDTVAKFDANQVVGEKVAAATVENNTCDNVTVEYFNTEGILNLGGSKWAVTSKEGFLKIAEKLALNVWHSQFTLWADIDLQGVAWTPIAGGIGGDYDYVLDGNNHTISNLTINGEGQDNVGLFSTFGGVIRNLTVTGANVKGNKRVGVLAGQGSCCFFENVKVANSVVTSTGYRVGGLVGQTAVDGNYKNCTVDHTTLSGQKYIGGITGSTGSGDAVAAPVFEEMTVQYTTISCCDQSAKVNGSYGAFVGVYFKEPVRYGTNIDKENDICSPNEGFGQHE